MSFTPGLHLFWLGYKSAGVTFMNNQYSLIIVDTCSKWPEIVPVTQIYPSTTTMTFNSRCAQFEVPGTTIMDNKYHLVLLSSSVPCTTYNQIDKQDGSRTQSAELFKSNKEERVFTSVSCGLIARHPTHPHQMLVRRVNYFRKDIWEHYLLQPWQLSLQVRERRGRISKRTIPCVFLALFSNE